MDISSKKYKPEDNETLRHVVCLKWGTRYSSSYVNRLYAMVQRNLNLPHSFHCLTDNATGINENVNILPLPKYKHMHGWWYKLLIFQKNFYGLTGELLFIDLDMVIMNNIDPFFTFAPGEFCVVKNAFKKHPISSSVMRLSIGSQPEIWDNFIDKSAKIIQDLIVGGDQYWIAKSALNYRFYDEKWVQFYKKHCKHRLLPIDIKLSQNVLTSLTKIFKLYSKEPKNCKILAFQQKPDIHEILHFPSGKYRAAPWLNKYWH